MTSSEMTSAHLSGLHLDGRDTFPTHAVDLPDAIATPTIEPSDGDIVDLRVTPVSKEIGDSRVRMLAYNGSIPGPTLHVRQGSELVVNASNDGDLPTTMHWHGLRLENRFDGTHHTQDPIQVGGSFSYRLSFPDPGLYWYHPHIRQDYGQEMGLYGTIVVAPIHPDYWPPVHREISVTLDDILLTDSAVAPFSTNTTTHTAMGRFGDVLLVNGDPNLTLNVSAGEVVRLYLVNTANTRTFDVAIPGVRMKLVGGDSGHCEHEEFVGSVVLAPSERAVVDVQFGEAGQLTMEHHTPDRIYPLAEFTVNTDPALEPLADRFDALRTNADMVAERRRIAARLNADPDKTIAFVAEMDLDAPESASFYSCPMHPEVSSTEAGRCPDCGMKLLLTASSPGHDMTGAGHHAPAAPSHEHGDHQHGSQSPAPGDGIEWEDDMVEVNRMTTPANMRWMLVDRATGARNHDIDWRFRVGDQVKVRLINEMDSDHPMHHPFHLHGAGRFLIMTRDGSVEPNLTWKDTVLVRRGETVDILLDVTNPGVWMAHCHISEHHESGMMFNFRVDPATAPPPAR